MGVLLMSLGQFYGNTQFVFIASLIIVGQDGHGERQSTSSF